MSEAGGIPPRMDWGPSAREAPFTPSRRTPQVDPRQVDPKLREAAQGFEKLFLNQLMKTMRRTVPESEAGLENGATKIYRGMLDSEYSEIAARTGGIGLSDQIIAHLTAARYNLKPGNPDTNLARQGEDRINGAQGRAPGRPEKTNPEVRTGGTDESL